VSEIPRFTANSVTRTFLETDLGDTFQRFAYELLAYKFGHLKYWPTRGRDGGIDLIHSDRGKRVFIECKYIGEDGLASARARWLKTKTNLATNLVQRRQRQYRPWWSLRHPVREYVFCVSSVLKNLGQADELHDEITSFFHQLASRHDHLNHLATLSVSVLDWHDLEGLLRHHPHKVFRWFERTRPLSLTPIDEEPKGGTFRSYLQHTRLPYYSRAMHQASYLHPEGVHIPTEDMLLESLTNEHIDGIIITGPGGIGKTRLGLEIGWVALQRGWAVLRASERVNERTIDRLLESIEPHSPTLLIVDYIERNKSFPELADHIADLNDTYNFKLRYVANCRTSYYGTVAGLRHKRVELVPLREDAQWHKHYRERVVQHILRHSGVDVTERHLDICRDIPVLAVFILYLLSTSRSTELTDLLREDDFGRWVRKRVQVSFGAVLETNEGRNLALLIALFPMLDRIALNMDPQIYRSLFERLASDGWIERTVDTRGVHEDIWTTVHDILADRIVLSHIEGIPAVVDHFVRDLLMEALKYDCLKSALLTLQRLINEPQLQRVGWKELFVELISTESGKWIEVRDILLRTPLLADADRLALFDRHESFWMKAITTWDFQNALGALTRRYVLGNDEDRAAVDRHSLLRWVRITTPHCRDTNLLLNWGLRLSPENVRDEALSWINARPSVFATNYLLVAWLEAGLPPREVAEVVRVWAETYGRHRDFSFLARAWLEATSDPGLLRDSIASWLREYGASGQAVYVYRAWLEANGDVDLVRPHIKAWLDQHGSAENATYVFRPWLSATRDPEMLRPYLAKWITRHGAVLEANYVYAAFLRARGGVRPVREQLAAWLQQHGTTVDAGFVYPAWLDKTRDTEFIHPFLAGWLQEHGQTFEAWFVFDAWLRSEGSPELVRPYFRAWLKRYGSSPTAGLLYRAWLTNTRDPDLIRDYVAIWLEGNGEASEARFVYNAWLTGRGDIDFIRPHLSRWLDRHMVAPEARMVYEALLQTRQDRVFIRPYLIKWFELNANTSSARALYRTWLTATHDASFIAPYLIAWLSEYGETEQAQSMYVAWLAASGSPSLVRPYLGAWFNIHGGESGAAYVYRMWLAASGDADFVRAHVSAWLELHGGTPNARFVYAGWLASGGDPELIRADVTTWLRHRGALRGG
jgi:hypothetical protein